MKRIILQIFKIPGFFFVFFFALLIVSFISLLYCYISAICINTVTNTCSQNMYRSQIKNKQCRNNMELFHGQLVNFVISFIQKNITGNIHLIQKLQFHAIFKTLIYSYQENVTTTSHFVVLKCLSEFELSLVSSFTKEKYISGKYQFYL